MMSFHVSLYMYIADVCTLLYGIASLAIANWAADFYQEHGYVEFNSLLARLGGLFLLFIGLYFLWPVFWLAGLALRPFGGNLPPFTGKPKLRHIRISL